MKQSSVDDSNLPSTSSASTVSFPTLRHRGGNVFRLLAQREISPQAKKLSKRLWVGSSTWNTGCCQPKCDLTDTRHGLISWVEAESFWHLSAKYCPLLPSPRSTIAAAFSLDGKFLASTHGDHTVKIIDCETGSCLKVLSGHRRTPWVVRFHPVHPEILASGSLDNEVRLWDANTSECIGSHDFYRPIASIAFHARGEVLAVASGHKLYIWHYNKRGDTHSPAIVLKTRRSLRAVHFHPHAAPFLLTAEANDLDSPDCPMALATSPGYLHYPPPAVFFANVHASVNSSLEARVPLIPFPCFSPTYMRQCGTTSLQHDNRATGLNVSQQSVESSSSAQPHTDLNRIPNDYLVSPMEMPTPVTPSSNFVQEDVTANCLLSEMANEVCDSMDDSVNATAKISNGSPFRMPIKNSRLGVEFSSDIPPSNLPSNTDLQMLLRNVDVGQFHHFSHSGDPASWDLPFLQGWLMGQTQASLHPVLPLNDAPQESSSGIRQNEFDNLASDTLAPRSLGTPASSAMASQSRGSGRSGSRHRPHSCLLPEGSGEVATAISVRNDGIDLRPGVGRAESEVAASLSSASGTELPFTVKLRIWSHNIQDPCAPLDVESCGLTVPHAVLCSEMGAHFSPCGRFLAACVACVLPQTESEAGFQSQAHHDAAGVARSPTRHPVSAHQVMYELRIYSLEKETFGSVLASRAIRAAHCLTSIQFSPTSEHILLAYGRRHSSLLRGIFVDGETTIPIYTILEIYRVSDMELVRVLPSAEDEVNVACFHPLAGGGLVYGTKEGKLRILQYDGSHGINFEAPNFFLDDAMLEVQTHALEC